MRRMHSVMRKTGVALSTLALAGMSLSPCVALAEPASGSQGAPSEKIETVNVTTAADGTVQDIEIETTLKNDDGAAKLTDTTNLTDIEADDDVTFSQSGSDLVWDAEGESVTYSGKIDADLPVAIKVTYTLDGVQVSAADLAGKSGKVTIRYDYENLSSHQAQVNGSTADLVTPFTCITAIMLDGDTFKNVSVTNGKIIEDGSDVVVAGYAMPGLQDSLGSLAEDADIPSYFEVTADVEDFELKTTMTIVTAGLMADFDADDLDFDDMNESTDELESAMTKLVEGSSTLYDGMNALSQGASALDEGADALATGSRDLTSGLYQLAYGTDGKGGLAGAAGSAQELAAGAEQADAAAQALADGVQGVPASADALAQAAAAAPTAEALQALMNDANYEGLSDESKQTIKALIEESQRVSTISPALTAQAKGAETLAQSMPALSGGASALANGLGTAAAASAQLYAGAAGLAEGAGQLSDASSQLSSGMSSATDGTKALSDGLQTFDREGIAKLTDMVRSDLGGFQDRLAALSDASRAYDNFGGKDAGTSGSVKFVYETEAITAE